MNVYRNRSVFKRFLRMTALSMAGLFSAMLPVSTMALDSDSQQPIDLVADRAEMDDQKGISTYIGNVHLTQGTLELTGDRLIIESSNGDPRVVITFGKPGRFKQRPEGKSEDVVATASRIKYQMDEERVLLDGDALIVQGGQRFRGEHITYDINADKVKARGGSGTTGGGRVHMTLPGKQQ
ncbi:MAG TPA: lipopolysaccharide transport periplasmic protein LptA [Gammaproteobacteria bacterium]|nr:lipopolysaccharide transport periplasmic protein LptA [Gammaproteobacteria bacterium]